MAAVPERQEVQLHRNETLVVSFAPDPVSETAERLQDEVDRLKASISGFETWVRDAIDNNVLLRMALGHVQTKLHSVDGSDDLIDYIDSVLTTSQDRSSSGEQPPPPPPGSAGSGGGTAQVVRQDLTQIVVEAPGTPLDGRVFCLTSAPSRGHDLLLQGGENGELIRLSFSGRCRDDGSELWVPSSPAGSS